MDALSMAVYLKDDSRLGNQPGNFRVDNRSRKKYLQ